VPVLPYKPPKRVLPQSTGDIQPKKPRRTDRPRFASLSYQTTALQSAFVEAPFDLSAASRLPLDIPPIVTPSNPPPLPTTASIPYVPPTTRPPHNITSNPPPPTAASASTTTSLSTVITAWCHKCLKAIPTLNTPHFPCYPQVLPIPVPEYRIWHLGLLACSQSNVIKVLVKYANDQPPVDFNVFAAILRTHGHIVEDLATSMTHRFHFWLQCKNLAVYACLQCRHLMPHRNFIHTCNASTLRTSADLNKHLLWQAGVLALYIQKNIKTPVYDFPAKDRAVVLQSLPQLRCVR